MRKHLPAIIFFTIVVGIALVILSSNLGAMGWNMCWCQSSECMAILDYACDDQYDWVGFSVVYSRCYGSDCYTFYRVMCEDENGEPYCTYQSCQDPCGSWCDN